ncbi:DNA alkylation repair enzyme [Ruminococcus sp. YRD2003]|nr:DNA alkylation repair enzyme [Ruminococcus flavefaciens]
MRDFDECIRLTDDFLPYIDNWATCDQLSPNVFAKHSDKLLPYIDKWLASELTYTVRFAVCSLMRYFLGDSFRSEYADRVAAVSSDEYYINMMRAWYFATALAKNYNEVLPYIVQKKLDVWTHNKTIQKAVESFRITDEQKQFLRTLKVKGA